MRLNTLLAALLGGVLMLTQPVAADTLVPVPQPTPMPSFKIPGINGSSGSDVDLRNKVTIIRFWASW
ncbi:MAG: hypothetical protein Q8L65_16170 [Burkholderiales bacterium]|nr:hypothetical protein [Burkholderiales bacterium]MDP2399535.1 hypothetical protein [Burkholderiales bacterium]